MLKGRRGNLNLDAINDDKMVSEDQELGRKGRGM